MNGINLKGFRVRSFMIGGLTAKWGIGENRVPPIWDNNLIGYWDARTFPDGALATIPNTATMAGKAPDLAVTGATMANGTLQFDGVNDGASTAAFLFPEKFTIFWDIDMMGAHNVWGAGIKHSANFIMYFRPGVNELAVFIKEASQGAIMPGPAVGLSTSAQYWTKDGTAALYTGPVGLFKGSAPLYVGKNAGDTVFTQMGFRQLLIFNKELSPAEVNKVLTVMFPV